MEHLSQETTKEALAELGISQQFPLTVSKEESARVTQDLSGLIIPFIVGTIEYRMSLDDRIHQTGFIFLVQRSGFPQRPVSAEKNRSPFAIFPDEGDIPAAEVIFIRTLLEGGYAD